MSTNEELRRNLQIEELHAADKRAQWLRESLGYSSPSEVITKWLTDEGCIIAVADGYGQAVVRELDGDDPEQAMEVRASEPMPEKEAEKLAERWYDGEDEE